VIGYYSWGSNDRTAGARHLNNHFVPGAVAAEFVSTDARTFVEPPADWVVNDPNKPFRGSPQSLIGDFIRHVICDIAVANRAFSARHAGGIKFARIRF
jgi:hypothetical protein